MWTVLRRFWWVPIVLVVAVIALVVSRGRNRGLLRVIKTQQDAYKAELELNATLRRKKEERLARVEEKYETSIQELERMYRTDRANIHKKEKKRLHALIDENLEHPGTLSDKLALAFGLRKT